MNRTQKIMFPHRNAPAAALFRLLALSALLLGVSHAQVAAQESAVVQTAPLATGTVRGNVSQHETGSMLHGAVVTLMELGVHTNTDASGNFEFVRVPAGNYTLRVDYTGLALHESAVTVDAEGMARALVELRADAVLELEEFRVVGTREGNAASITRQRQAENVVNVVAMDAFGNVADGNIGNFLQKLPGVGTVTSAGDVIGVNVRGIPSEFSSVTQNDTRLASAYAGSNTQGDRAVAIDQIPAEFIKEIELNKVLTPDRSADAVGGSVNLVTKTAFDYKKPLFTYRAGANINTYRLKEWAPTGAFSYLRRFGVEEKWGVALTGSYSGSNNTRDRVIMRHVEYTDMLTQLALLDDELPRQRAGGSLRFDYRPNDSTELYFNAQHNYYSYYSHRHSVTITPGASRRIADYSVRSRADIEAGQQARSSSNQVAGVAPGFTETFTEWLGPGIANNNAEGERLSWQYRAELGGKKKLSDDQTVWFKASYNPTRYREHYKGFNVRFLTGTAVANPRVGIAIDTSGNSSIPLVTQTYGPNIGPGTDPTLWRGTMFTEPETMDESISSASVDYEKQFLHWSVPTKFKAGLAVRRQDRSNVIDDHEYNYTGPGDIGQFRKDVAPYATFRGATGITFDKYDYFAVRAAYDAHPEWFTEVLANAVKGANDLVEDIYSAYVMGTVGWGKLGVVGGVRFEGTRLDVEGDLSDPQRPDLTRISRKGKYDNFFPSLNIRYEPIPRVVLRAAYSSAITRPPFADLYLTTSVNHSNTSFGGIGHVVQTNPNLKPQYAQNYDLSVEYYLEPAGVVSVGYFFKDMTDFIHRNISIIDDGGIWDGYSQLTKTNLGSATVEGFEVNYSQQFTFLPKPFNGLSAFANYTHIKTEGSYADGAAELARFIPENFNAGLSFTWRKLELKASYNYQADHLWAYNNDEPRLNERMKAAELWDFNLQYRFSRTMKFFVDVSNAFNEHPDIYYSGQDKARILTAERFGTRVSVGVSGRF